MKEIEEILKENKKLYSSFGLGQVNIQNLLKVLMSYFDVLEAAFNNDKKTFEKVKFEQIIEKYVHNVTPVVSTKTVPYGNIVALTNGNPYITLELCILAILTNNSIIFLNEVDMVHTNQALIEIIKEFLQKENKNENQVNFQVIDNFKTISQYQDLIDCMIIIGDYDKYHYCSTNMTSKVIFSDYTNINIYTDTDFFDEGIQFIIEKAAQMDILVYLYRMKDINELLEIEGNNFVFHTTAIYTQDAKEAFTFIDKIKSKNVYINKNPLETYALDITEEDLVYHKKIRK